jgi:cation-transporting ATPase I
VLVGGNAGEVAFTVVGTALGGRSPLGTRQLLLVNLLTDMFPALAVAVAPPRRPDDPGTRPDDPLAGHPLAEELRAGPHRGFTTAVRRLVLVRGAATAAGATGAWATGRLTGSRSRAGSMGLAALISTQLAQTAWAGRRSPLVLVTAAGSFAVLVGVVQTPVVSRFFGCRPLDPFAWAAVLGWSAAGAAGAELVPRWLAGLQESHTHATSLQESGFPDGPDHPGDASGADGDDADDPGDTTTRAGVSVPAGTSEPT